MKMFTVKYHPRTDPRERIAEIRVKEPHNRAWVASVAINSEEQYTLCDERGFVVGSIRPSDKGTWSDVYRSLGCDLGPGPSSDAYRGQYLGAAKHADVAMLWVFESLGSHVAPPGSFVGSKCL